MRTTITMDDHLLDQLKARAAASGSTVSRLIEEAVRVMLNRPADQPETRGAFELVTYGAGGQFTEHNIDKTADLMAAEDRERYRKEP
jgi:metal-responsive CopG/Arc/MetJ family transcriptional regulator